MQDKICRMYGVGSYLDLKHKDFKGTQKQQPGQKDSDELLFEKEYMMSQEYLTDLKMKKLRDALRPNDSYRNWNLAELKANSPTVEVSPFFSRLAEQNVSRKFSPFIFDFERSMYLKRTTDVTASDDIYGLIDNLRQKVNVVTEFIDNDFVNKVRNFIIPDNERKLDAFIQQTDQHLKKGNNNFEKKKFFLENFVFTKYDGADFN